MFEGVGVVYKNLKMSQVTNFTAIRRKILSLLGRDYEFPLAIFHTLLNIYGIF